MIEVTDRLWIPEDELDFTAGPSSGPGGQNVNKVSTRVTLRFDVAHSPSLSPEQRDWILSRLRSRLSKEGVLQIVSQQSRSQAANREAAIERFAQVLRESLHRSPPRKKTRIPYGAKLRRLDEKKRRSRIKQARSRALPTE